jgi:hypothetical protein
MADTYARRTVIGPKRGRGKVILSQGIAPAEKILPDVALPTLLKDPDPDISNHFELILLKGTICAVYSKTYDNGKTGTVIGPCNGLAGCELAQVILTTATGAVSYEAVGHTATSAEVDLGVKYVPKGLKSGASAADKISGQKSQPLGIVTVDAYRPFSYGENEGVGFQTHGYVEWPTVKKVDKGSDGLGTTVVFDNTDLRVGDFVKSDAVGRPVKWRAGVDPEFLRIGRVVAQDVINADYDFGLLNYFYLPQTSDQLEESITALAMKVNAIDPATNTVTNVFGLRPNVDGLLTLIDPATAVAGATGAVRVQLLGM